MTSRHMKDVSSAKSADNLEKAAMEWSNEKCIEFIHLYKSEPCLWDTRLPTHKNRIVQGDAWYRIVNGLSFPATLEDVKTKRNSLMGYYRIHINKYKKSLKYGEDVYTTSWFAFDLMHSFLGPLYTHDCSTNEVYLTTTNEGNNEMMMISDSEFSQHSMEQPLHSMQSIDATQKDLTKETSAIEKKRERQRKYREQNREKLKQMEADRRRRKQNPEKIGMYDVYLPADAEQSADCPYPMPSSSQVQISSTHTIKRSLSSSSDHSMDHYEPPAEVSFPATGDQKPIVASSYDEYDHFGLMIASKIRKIDSFEERETVMNVIQNIVFQSVMKMNSTNDLPPS